MESWSEANRILLVLTSPKRNRIDPGHLLKKPTSPVNRIVKESEQI